MTNPRALALDLEELERLREAVPEHERTLAVTTWETRCPPGHIHDVVRVEGPTAKDQFSAFEDPSKELCAFVAALVNQSPALISLLREARGMAEFYGNAEHMDFPYMLPEDKDALLTHEKIGGRNVLYVESGRRARAFLKRFKEVVG